MPTIQLTVSDRQLKGAQYAVNKANENLDPSQRKSFEQYVSERAASTFDSYATQRDEDLIARLEKNDETLTADERVEAEGLVKARFHLQ